MAGELATIRRVADALVAEGQGREGSAGGSRCRPRSRAEWGHGLRQVPGHVAQPIHGWTSGDPSHGTWPSTLTDENGIAGGRCHS